MSEYIPARLGDFMVSAKVARWRQVIRFFLPQHGGSSGEGAGADARDQWAQSGVPIRGDAECHEGRRLQQDVWGRGLHV